MPLDSSSGAETACRKPTVRPASCRRVGARPCVCHGDEAGRHGRSIDDEAPVPIDDAAHRENARDRLAVEPMRVEGTAADGVRPLLLMAEALQRLVPGRGEDRDGPGAVVGRKREERHPSDAKTAFERSTLNAEPPTQNSNREHEPGTWHSEPRTVVDRAVSPVRFAGNSSRPRAW